MLNILSTEWPPVPVAIGQITRLPEQGRRVGKKTPETGGGMFPFHPKWEENAVRILVVFCVNSTSSAGATTNSRNFFFIFAASAGLGNHVDGALCFPKKYRTSTSKHKTKKWFKTYCKKGWKWVNQMMFWMGTCYCLSSAYSTNLNIVFFCSYPQEVLYPLLTGL